MSDLKVRRVVLYKHGVGYYEREATVTGLQSLTLGFKQREVSDVLKSLTVLDLSGGVVSAVSYESTTPIEQLLAEIALSIPDQGSLTGLLPQLKGAQVSVKVTGESDRVTGVILGIDTNETRTSAGIAKQIRLSILTEKSEVRTFDLFDVQVQLLDESLRRDLDFYLKTNLAAKKKDARSFTLFCEGAGERQIRVSYVLEAPVWKATYRILLNEATSGGEATQPLIQGWAVVDNTSDEDWENIDLSLVAGLPVSFVHDLYTPRYVRRPVVQVKESTGVLPPTAEAAVDSMLMMYDEEGEDSDAMEGALSAGPARMRKISAARSINMVSAARGGSPRDSGVSSVATQTRERQVGDLFEYTIDRPITVRRNQSALVPIVLKPFSGRTALLYQKEARPQNPMRCIEFENTTGLTLEGGPITVLDKGSYVGEAMLDTLKPTEQRLIGYAVELAVKVLDNIESFDERVSRVVIRGGTLKAHYANVRQTTYTFSSKADKDQTLYLDHPREGSKWTLLDNLKPHEITENFWRFKLTVTSNGVTKFVVRQQQPTQSSFSLSDFNDKQLVIWIEAKYLDAKSIEVLRQALTLRQEIADLETQLANIASEQQKITADQKRIRENLSALADRTSDKELRERYLRTLSQQEDRLEKLEAETQQRQKDRDTNRVRLNNVLARLEYDAAV